VKHIFRYLVGTQDYGIKFGPNEPLGPMGYTYSDYAGCLDTRKSTSGYIFKFGNGLCGTPVGCVLNVEAMVLIRPKKADRSYEIVELSIPLPRSLLQPIQALM
jgi:hypothetical protein